MFIVQLAGINILIKPVFPQTEIAFVDFTTDEKYDYCINITKRRIVAEEKLLRSSYPQKHFKDFEIEVNALYRDIPKILINENIVLFHGVLI